MGSKVTFTYAWENSKEVGRMKVNGRYVRRVKRNNQYVQRVIYRDQLVYDDLKITIKNIVMGGGLSTGLIPGLNTQIEVSSPYHKFFKAVATVPRVEGIMRDDFDIPLYITWRRGIMDASNLYVISTTDATVENNATIITTPNKLDSYQQLETYMPRLKTDDPNMHYTLKIEAGLRFLVKGTIKTTNQQALSYKRYNGSHWSDLSIMVKVDEPNAQYIMRGWGNVGYGSQGGVHASGNRDLKVISSANGWVIYPKRWDTNDTAHGKVTNPRTGQVITWDEKDRHQVYDLNKNTDENAKDANGVAKIDTKERYY